MIDFFGWSFRAPFCGKVFINRKKTHRTQKHIKCLIHFSPELPSNGYKWPVVPGIYVVHVSMAQERNANEVLRIDNPISDASCLTFHCKHGLKHNRAKERPVSQDDKVTADTVTIPRMRICLILKIYYSFGTLKLGCFYFPINISSAYKIVIP